MVTDPVTIENRRFELDQGGALSEIADQFAKAFGYTAQHLDLDPMLAQLLRLRVAQINNCTYCLNLHSQVARDLDIPRAKIDTLSAWWRTDLHAPAEQAALAYTEALTRHADTTAAERFEAVHADLATHFNERQIADIVGVVINMNLWTRLKLAQGSTPTA